jgi:hypothetical protein
VKLPRAWREQRFALMWQVLAVIGAGGIVFLADILLRPAEVGPAQPIPFSHRVHAGVRQIDCLFCHDAADRSDSAGMPGTEKCLLCHRIIIPDLPRIERIEEYNDRNEAVPWVRIYRLPAYVRFSHQVHLAGFVDCGECHGDVKAMDRISQVWPATMGSCIHCMRQRQAPIGCWVCHY